MTADERRAAASLAGIYGLRLLGLFMILPVFALHADDYTGATRWVHQELRDRKVAIFIDRLGQGVWEFRYDLRAEVPGEFHALPVLGHAMYVPEIRANGSESRIEVLDPSM